MTPLLFSGGDGTPELRLHHGPSRMWGALTLLLPLGISHRHPDRGGTPRVGRHCRRDRGVPTPLFLPTHQVKRPVIWGPGAYRTRDYIKIGGPP